MVVFIASIINTQEEKQKQNQKQTRRHSKSLLFKGEMKYTIRAREGMWYGSLGHH